MFLEADQEEAIDQLLAEANGRRTARVLSRLDVIKTMAEALGSGFALRTGGSVDDARAQSTLVLVVKTEKGLKIGIGAARGSSPEPGQLWPQLDRWIPDGSVSCLQRADSWARRPRPRTLEVEIAPQKAPAGNAGDALHAAVLEEPDSNDRRRVYADMLQERGDPRGELISVQLMLEELDEDDSRRTPLREREVLLHAALEARWRQRLGDHVITLEFKRGFVESATLHGSGLVDPECRALLETEPVRQLRFIDISPEDVPRLLLTPWLSRLTALELHHLDPKDRRRALNAEDVVRLLDTEKLRGLKRLDFTGHALDDTGLMMLAHNVVSAVPRLEQLVVARDGLTPVGVGVLVEHHWFQRLQALDLRGNHLGMGGAAMVANAVSPLKMKTLDLGTNLLGDEGARVLAGSPRLQGLEFLGLYANHIGPYGARQLLDSPFLRGVKRFNLEGNRIGSVAAKRLLEKASP